MNILCTCMFLNMQTVIPVYLRIKWLWHRLFFQISWHDPSRICRWAAGGSRRCLPNQGEPKTARDTHLGLKVSTPSACSAESLKGRPLIMGPAFAPCPPFSLLIHPLNWFNFNFTSSSTFLNPGLVTRPSTTDCSMTGSTLSGRRGSSRSTTSWRTPSSLSTSRPRRLSTLPKWPRTPSTSILVTLRCSRTRWCTGWAGDAQNHAESPSRGMKGWVLWLFISPERRSVECII